MDEILKISKEFKIKIIEDAAQGVGVHYKNKHVGTFGDIGVLSYYGNKTITTAEGGMILTQNEKIYKSCYRLKNHGRDKKGTFIHENIGYNFAFTDLQAAIGVAQMKKLKKIIKRKKEIFDMYFYELNTIKEIEFYKINDQSNQFTGFHQYISMKKKLLKNIYFLMGFKQEIFYPLHLQPCYKNMDLNIKDNFDISEKIFRNSLSLPSSVILKDKEIRRVIKLVKAF